MMLHIAAIYHILEPKSFSWFLSRKGIVEWVLWKSSVKIYVLYK